MSPRLYLDTGDLNRIADRREEGTVVDALRATMVATQTRLVLSHAHMQDALSQTDDATKERFVKAIESFQPILLVTGGPAEVEPLDSDRRDIIVAPCTNFREIAFSPAARPWLENANVTQDQMHLGDKAAQIVRRNSPPSVRTVAHSTLELFVQSAVTLIRGWAGDDISAIVSYWEAAGSFSPSPKDRVLIITQLSAIRAMLEPLRETIARDEIDMTTVLRRLGTIGTEPAAYPGLRLMVAVGADKQHEVARHRQRSDWVDLDHVAHFPYVDVATCDAGTFHFVSIHLKNIETPRKVSVLKNGNLAQVTEAIRTAARAR